MKFFPDIKFSSFFKKGNQPPAKPVEPDSEDPKEVTGSILHPPAPTGTRFNRKMLMILASVAGLVMIFAFMAALQPPKKLTPREEAEESAKKPQTTNYAPTPEAISTAPDTYAGLRSFQEAQQIKRGDIPGKGAIPDEGVGSVKAISPASINQYNAQAGGGVPQLSEAEKERLDARKSPIRFLNAPSTTPQASSLPPIPAVLPAQVNVPVMPWQKDDDQNMQAAKRDFVVDNEKATKDVYVKSGVISPLSKYEVKAGSIIPGVMITGINSDLPGKLTGQVRENVYDTVTGKYLLIPQGTRVIGTYDSKVAYSQERVLIVWTRLIFPNGDSIDLEGMAGVDLSGYAGMKDKVNNHYGKLITGVVLSSMLSAGAKVAAGNNDVGTATFSQQATSGAAQQVSTVGAKFADRNLNVQPTIEIRPGMKFNVFVNKDLILKRYRT